MIEHMQVPVLVNILGAHVMYDCMAVTVAWHAHTS